MRARTRQPIGALLSVVAVCVLATVTDGTTVAPMGVQALSNLAGQVIVARVSSSTSYWAEAPQRIETRLEFADVAYLKGGATAASHSPFSLVVPGGRVGTWQMEVMGAPVFEVGDRWVLFLLPTYRTFPVVGLNGGAFRIVADGDGVDRVFGATGLGVAGINEFGQIQEIPLASDSPDRFVVHKTSGVRVIERGSAGSVAAPGARPVSLAAFVEQLRPFLERSTDHALEQPAGQRVLVEYTPVTLQASGRPAAENAPQPVRCIRERSNEVRSEAFRGREILRNLRPQRGSDR